MCNPYTITHLQFHLMTMLLNENMMEETSKQ